MATDKGKIIIVQLNEKRLSILIKDNAILSAQVHRPNDYAVGNIYVGKVQSISENIAAAFVDLGQGYLTFLPLAEAKNALVVNRKPDGKLKADDEIVVQIAREPVKTKLAGVTTRISLAGKYAVVAKKNVITAKRSADEENVKSIIQVSSKLSGEQQSRFRNMEALRQTAKEFQLIVRTNAGELKEDEPLIAESKHLAEQLAHVLEIADKRTCYSCLYREKPDYLHFIENSYTTEYDEIVTDIPEIYDTLKESLEENDVPVRLYEDAMFPLHKLYAVETRIKELLDKKVWLKSGGYLVIEPTEALISIDVNSGKYEHGKDKEETFLKINLEAAAVIALQLRARNLSGIIVVDFINMKKASHNQQLMEYMRSLLKQDSVTADVVDMTGLGLMEITRKKVNPGFREQYGEK